MSRGMPSMTALIGLLAIAGYQNRDKLAEMLREHGANNPNPSAGTAPQAGLGGLLSNLSGALGGAGCRRSSERWTGTTSGNLQTEWPG